MSFFSNVIFRDTLILLTINKGDCMYPQAYINFLVHFHGDRDYFECHEVLEEYWKEDEKDKRKRYWVALIQIAVSLYHHRRGNYSGSLKMMRNALFILESESEALALLGLNKEKLLTLLKNRIIEIDCQQPYSSLFLPIEDEELLRICKTRCLDTGLVWGSVSDISNNSLVNRHTLRDRNNVIEERLKQKIKKNRMQD